MTFNQQSPLISMNMYKFHMVIVCVAFNREGIALEMTIKSSTTIQYNRMVNICGASDANPCQLKRSAIGGRNALKDS